MSFVFLSVGRAYPDKLKHFHNLNIEVGSVGCETVSNDILELFFLMLHIHIAGSSFVFSHWFYHALIANGSLNYVCCTKHLHNNHSCSTLTNDFYASALVSCTFCLLCNHSIDIQKAHHCHLCVAV